ncbi:hypothetical protein CC86DRAFT_273896, partial [Ophiobolus disseminans]
KAKEEHLIFVKNVPADLATGSLLDLFARYEPLRIKNVYPNSDITTVVVSFRTFDEASYAQEDTDGIRLDNVVLRVEMFSKHRSVRYLREERNAHRPLGAVDEEYEDETEDQPHYVHEAGDVIVLDSSHASLLQDKGATTWAQIAKKKQPLGMAPLPAPIALSSLHPVVSKEAVTSTPKLTVAVPRLPDAPGTDDDTSELDLTDDSSLQSPATSSAEVAGYEADVEDNREPKNQFTPTKDKTRPSSGIMAPWEPVDSTERIRQRHCRDCVFCQMRIR